MPSSTRGSHLVVQGPNWSRPTNLYPNLVPTENRQKKIRFPTMIKNMQINAGQIEDCMGHICGHGSSGSTSKGHGHRDVYPCWHLLGTVHLEAVHRKEEQGGAGPQP